MVMVSLTALLVRVLPGVKRLKCQTPKQLMLGVRMGASQPPEDVDAASRGAQSPENTCETATASRVCSPAWSMKTVAQLSLALVPSCPSALLRARFLSEERIGGKQL